MSGLSTLYSRLLQDLQTGDDAARDIAASALPAHLPGVHLASALGGVASASCHYLFNKGAFDTKFDDLFAAGRQRTTAQDEDNQRRQNGGMTQAERTMAMLDAQEEYLQEWMKGSSTIAGLTLSNAEHHELATRLKNDEQFRTLVITQMLQQNAQFSQKDAEFGIEGYQRLVEIGKINKAALSPEERAKLEAEANTLSHDDRVVAAASASNIVENSLNTPEAYEKQNNQNLQTDSNKPPETKIAVAELGFN